MKNDKTIKALVEFRKAYFNLLEEWDNRSDILDNTENYPFHESFDDLKIAEWIDDILEDNKK